jgi:hypothetical protein
LKKGLSGGVSSIAAAKSVAETKSSLAGVDKNFSSNGVSDAGERRLSASRLADETILIGERAPVLAMLLPSTVELVDPFSA